MTLDLTASPEDQRTLSRYCGAKSRVQRRLSEVIVREYGDG